MIETVAIPVREDDRHVEFDAVAYFACESCGAQPGDRCLPVTGGGCGRELRRVHAARRYEAIGYRLAARDTRKAAK